jgi:Zn-dependent peptidase ImmA (M78 family)
MIEKQPKNDTPPKFKHGFKKKAEDLGLKIREEMGLSIFSPLDAFALAKHKNIPVFTFDEILFDLEAERTLLNNHPSFSALYTITRDGEKIILYKNTDSSARQQSNIMHEIAHILLEHSIPENLLNLASKFGLTYNNELQENEAKFLGGCLQLTKPSLFASLKKSMTHLEIAEKYFASVEMVNYRINISGVQKVKDYQARKNNSSL